MPEEDKSDQDPKFHEDTESSKGEVLSVSPVDSMDRMNDSLASVGHSDSRMKTLEQAYGGSREESIRVVVFSLAGQEHAVEVHQVKEILMAPPVAPLIEAHFFIEGVIKLRGKIVPVVDLRKALNLQVAQRSDQASIVIIVILSGQITGFRVDSVSELLTIPISLIEAPKGIMGGVDTHFVKGLAYFGDRFLVILDLDSILSVDQDHMLLDARVGGVFKDFDGTYGDQESFVYKRIISFNLGDEFYGADIGDVAEIMEMAPIMPIPNVPQFILGLINLRGTIVPVVDLRARFGLGLKAWTPESRIIIMKEKNLLVGVVVDSMWESMKLAEEVFQPVPHGVANVDAGYFRDICSVRGRMVSVLDIGKILTDTALKSLVSGSAEALEKQPTLRLESHG